MTERITTIAQARALPEVDNRTEPMPLSPAADHGDDIIAFIDTDKRPMEVIYTAQGPAKCEICM